MSRLPCSCEIHCGDDPALRTGNIKPCPQMTRWLLSHEGTAIADKTKAAAARDELVACLPQPCCEHTLGRNA
jgi:hypothetical protein